MGYVYLLSPVVGYVSLQSPVVGYGYWLSPVVGYVSLQSLVGGGGGLLAESCDGVLHMQKLRSPLLRTQSHQRFSL